MARFIASVFIGVLTTASLPSAGWGQAEFYRGKTVSMVIGSRLTGTLAISALAVSHHLGRHIPGNPTVILRQMPGGAHLNATNYAHMRCAPVRHPTALPPCKSPSRS
jgi:hypothetical protein